MKSKWAKILMVLFLISFSEYLQAEERSKKNNDQREKTLQEGILSPEEKQYLLTLTRKALEQYLKDGERISVDLDKLSPTIKEKRGCFVTLTKNGELRGCIGYLEPRKPLCDCIIENAINAAVNDRRFPARVTFEELASLSIEISVLTVPQKLEIKDRQELPRHLVANRDGLILLSGWHQSTYLPQVWEHFPDKEDFLNSLCRKGGMPGGCWKDEDTEIFTYQAEVFHE
jgi:AmmeMemoRadiSam system protein A